MNILMLGTGNGSWTVRGKQLGAALGARVTNKPAKGDLAWADVVVLIKWAGLDQCEMVRQSGKPFVWDALDFWKQPDQNGYSESKARGLLDAHLRLIQPTLMIGATQAMAQAGGGVYLPHHARPGLMPKLVRETVQIVAYEGQAKYLGKWARLVEQECQRRGWQFVINPPDLADADIIVAFRDGQWDGWMCRQWKSHVKAVNAVAAQRPIVMQPIASTDKGIDPIVVESPIDLSAAFDQWSRWDLRSIVADTYSDLKHDYTLESVARDYQRILERVA